MSAFREKLMHPSGVPLVMVRRPVLLGLEKHIDRREVEKHLASSGLELLRSGKDSRAIAHARHLYFLDADLTAVADLPALAKKTGLPIAWAMPLYRFADAGGELCAAKADVLMIRSDDGAAAERVLSVLKELHFAFDGEHVGPWRRAVRRDGTTRADELQELLSRLRGVHTELDFLPLHSAACAAPADAYFAQEWSLNLVGAQAAWGASATPRKGSTVAYLTIVDPSGAAVSNVAGPGQHVDLHRAENQGFDQANGSLGLVDVSTTTDAHGTALAGIAAGKWDDTDGLVGIAPGVGLYIVRPQSESSVDVALMLERAGNPVVASPPVGGAFFPGENDVNRRTVLLYGQPSSAVWATASLDTAIADVTNAGALLVSPAGNSFGGSTALQYPASNPKVIAVGATGPNVAGKVDMRVSTETEAGVFSQPWSSCYGSELDLVAPGHGVFTDDLPGDAGYNKSALGAADFPDRAFTKRMEGTSAAAAHVAGALALLRSTYPGLTAAQARDVLVRTADKISPGAYTYVATGNDPHRRYDEVGYGRLNVGRMMNDADVWISDGPGDVGEELSGVGAFWAGSDVVSQSIGPTANPWPDHAAALASFDSLLGQTPGIADNVDTYVYVRIRNRGPDTARNLEVRLTMASPSTGFLYPRDWKNGAVGATSGDRIALTPEPFAAEGHGTSSTDGSLYTIPTLANGAVAIARFRATAMQGAWARDNWGTHPCALAMVRANGDSALAGFPPGFPIGRDHAWADFEASFLADTGGMQPRRNNIIQRNMHTVHATSPWKYGFFVGNEHDPDEEIELHVQLHGLPPTTALLALGDWKRAFPRRRDASFGDGRRPHSHSAGRATLLEDARVKLEIGPHEDVITLRAGTHFDFATRQLDECVAHEGKELALTGASSRVRIRRRPGQVMPVYLEIALPPGAKKGDRFLADLVQRTRAGTVTGGIRLVLVA